MIRFDLYTKLVLTVIAVCLVCLVFQAKRPAEIAAPGSLNYSKTSVAAAGMSKLNYSKDDGVGIACSADGKHVYVAGTEGVVHSDDYGRLGSWEKTLKED